MMIMVMIMIKFIYSYHSYSGKCHLSELQANGKHSVGIDKRRGDRDENDDDDDDDDIVNNNNNDDDDDDDDDKKYDDDADDNDDDGNLIGKIVLSRSPDGLLHFKWINLMNNATEGNVIDVDIDADKCR